MTTSEPLTSICSPLREALTRNRYDTDTLIEVLGPEVHAALGRNEPVPVRRASASCGELGTLIRLFLLADTCPESDAAAALAPLTMDDAVAAGLLEREDLVGDDIVTPGMRAAVDVRPVDTGAGVRWVFSDLDGGMRPRTTGPEHVIGVGHASLSLLRATPTEPVKTLLDVGTGCGIQAIHADSYAERITATDINPRALALTAATLELNGLDMELAEGSWFTPVEGRQFDQVVANPPFVVSEAKVVDTYRDSGLNLDGASELMVSQVVDHLVPGGTAVLLASWLHVENEDWRARVASWIPAHGVDAWVVQRDVADPTLYVGTWMRDGGLDPCDPDSAQRAEQWLNHLEDADVEGIGFGFVYLRRTDSPSDLLAEDLTHGFEDPLGSEALDYFDRVAWLREHDVLTARFLVDEHTALERVHLPGDDGWEQVVVRVHRGNGPLWQHEVDDLTAALLAGMRADGLPLGELVEILAYAHDEDPEAIAEAAVPVVHSLVRHGLVTPADLAAAAPVP
ncbi:MAG: methyltransferase [Rhodococcus sp.]|nr:methyltransferase [Rhodococcus sp. (in: high G+C Gram-positive bacteria)]